MHDLLQENLSLFSNDFPNLEYLKLLKTGKEAEVHLVKDKNELLALKIYKQNSKYSSRHQYLHLHELGTGTVMRAVKNKNKAGKRLLADIWVNREFKVLSDLWEIGADVPEPLLLGKNAYLMEYLGNYEDPAPKLINVELSAEQSKLAFETIKKNIWLLLDLGYVHGDLSGYNILWWNEQPYIIDFPQVLSVFHNSDAIAKLMHDIHQVNDYFENYALKISDREQEELLMRMVF